MTEKTTIAEIVKKMNSAKEDNVDFDEKYIFDGTLESVQEKKAANGNPYVRMRFSNGEDVLTTQYFYDSNVFDVDELKRETTYRLKGIIKKGSKGYVFFRLIAPPRECESDKREKITELNEEDIMCFPITASEIETEKEEEYYPILCEEISSQDTNDLSDEVSEIDEMDKVDETPELDANSIVKQFIDVLEENDIVVTASPEVIEEYIKTGITYFIDNGEEDVINNPLLGKKLAEVIVGCCKDVQLDSLDNDLFNRMSLGLYEELSCGHQEDFIDEAVDDSNAKAEDGVADAIDEDETLASSDVEETNQNKCVEGWTSLYDALRASRSYIDDNNLDEIKSMDSKLNVQEKYLYAKNLLKAGILEAGQFKNKNNFFEFNDKYLNYYTIIITETKLICADKYDVNPISIEIDKSDILNVQAVSRNKKRFARTFETEIIIQLKNMKWLVIYESMYSNESCEEYFKQIYNALG